MVYLYLFFTVYFIDYAIIAVPFFLPFMPPPSCNPKNLQHFPLRSSCLWVIHISSLTSLFPILFLTSPCVFYAYQLCFLFPVSFPLILPLPLPTENPPCDPHFYGFVSVLVVCLVFVFVSLGSVVDSCEFVVVLLLIVFDLLFLR